MDWKIINRIQLRLHSFDYNEAISLQTFILLVISMLSIQSCEELDYQRVDFINLKMVNATVRTKVSAQVTGELSGLSQATINQHGFVWSNSNTSPSISDNAIFLGPRIEDGIFSSEIKNLSPNDTIYVRAFAVVESKGEVFSEPLQFTLPSLVINTSDEPQLLSNTALVFGQVQDLQPGEFAQEHGHCWSTETELPTIDDNRSNLGAAGG